MSLPRAYPAMKLFRTASDRAHSAGAILAALCLGACIFGGTGTDTDNSVVDKHTVTITGVSARVTDSAGAPLVGVSLRIFDPLYRPDSALTPAALVRNSADSLVSDTGGYVRLHLTVPGKFVVEGLDAAKTLFFDTLAVADTQSASVYTFRARVAKSCKGKVKLASGMRIDSGRVFIRGTGHSVKVDTAGNYDLGILPIDVGRMGLGMRFTSRPVAVRQAVPTGTDTSKQQYTCRDVPKDSAAKLSTPALQTTPAAIADTAKLDTGTVNPALKACDSLVKGSIISVVGQPEGIGVTKSDSVPDALLVLSGEQTANTVQGMRIIEPVVVPLNQCVPTAGSENTTYDLQLQSTPVSSDILVKDVAEKCLVK